MKASRLPVGGEASQLLGFGTSAPAARGKPAAASVAAAAVMNVRRCIVSPSRTSTQFRAAAGFLEALDRSRFVFRQYESGRIRYIATVWTTGYCRGVDPAFGQELCLLTLLRIVPMKVDAARTSCRCCEIIRFFGGSRPRSSNG